MSPEGNAGLDLELLRHDGAPAADTFVRVSGSTEDRRAGWRFEGRTDGAGRLRFDGLPAGPVRVTVREPGFLRGRPVELTLAAACRTPLRIREDAGRPVTVVVRDEAGDPVAGARVDLTPESWLSFAIVEDDVQRAGCFTDRDGRFVFPRAPEGFVRAEARLGSRRAEARGRAGDTLELRLGSR